MKKIIVILTFGLLAYTAIYAIDNDESVIDYDDMVTRKNRGDPPPPPPPDPNAALYAVEANPVGDGSVTDATLIISIIPAYSSITGSAPYAITPNLNVNGFDINFTAPTIFLPNSVLTFSLKNSIYATAGTYSNALPLFPRFQGSLTKFNTQNEFFQAIFLTFLRTYPTSLSAWFIYAHCIIHFKKYFKTYTFLSIPQNTATSITFKNAYTFTDSTSNPQVNKAVTYNNVTITLNGSHDLPLTPSLTFTFQQVRDTETKTTSYTIDISRMLTVPPVSFADSPLFLNDLSAPLDNYLNAFFNARTEPLLAYYSLMWFVASYSQKYPSFYVANNTQETTINMTGYNSDLFLNAVPQLTTDPADITNNVLPSKPLIRIPLVSSQAFRSTQYVTSAQFDITNTTALSVLNTLFIKYIEENTTRNTNYFALVAQINPNISTTFGAQLPKPYDQAFSLQGSPINNTVTPPIYFQLAYIINDIKKPAPYIKVDISKLNNAQSIQLGTLLFHFLVNQGSLSVKTWYHILAWYMITLLNTQTTSYTGFVPFLDNKGNVTSSILLPSAASAFQTLDISSAQTLITSIIRGPVNANLINATSTLGISSLLQNTQSVEPLITSVSSTTTNVEAFNNATAQDFLSRLIALYVITKNTTFAFTILNSPDKTNALIAYRQTLYYLQQFYNNPYLLTFVKTIRPPAYTYPYPLDSEYKNSSFAQRFPSFNDNASFLYATGGSNALEAIINDAALRYISTLSFLTNLYATNPTAYSKKQTLVQDLITVIEKSFVQFYEYALAARYNILNGAAS